VATIAAFGVETPVFVWPTAVQIVTEGQAMEVRLDNPVGAVSVVHVAPPSVVSKITAAPGVSPTPVQSEIDGHESWVRYWIPEGAVWLCQVAPPSVVPTMKGAPT
jgi:hypothetical protein